MLKFHDQYKIKCVHWKACWKSHVYSSSHVWVCFSTWQCYFYAWLRKLEVKNTSKEGFWSSLSFINKDTRVTVSLSSKCQSSARVGDYAVTQKMLRQVYKLEDLLAGICIWWRILTLNSESYFWGKMRKRREERQRERKGELSHWPAGKGSIQGNPGRHPSLCVLSRAAGNSPYSIFHPVLLRSDCNSQLPASHSTLRSRAAVLHAAWLLTLLLAFLASPYVNKELQWRARKRGERKSDWWWWFPLRTAVTTLVQFAGARS